MRFSERQKLYQNLEINQTLTFLHNEREKVVSEHLQLEPLNFKHYLHQAAIHYSLGYSDLAAGDAYKALTLLETYFDPDFSDFQPKVRDDEAEFVRWPEDDEAILDARRDMAECLRCLVLALTDLGCLRDAHTYLLQLQKLDEQRTFFTEEEYQDLWNSILRAQSVKRTNGHTNGDVEKSNIQPARLRNFGFARKELYRWNNHEPDRSSPKTVDVLNEWLRIGAPNLEVRSVVLPILEDPTKKDFLPSDIGTETLRINSSTSRSLEKSLQLGLFAKTDLPASSTIHHEPSILTAVRPIDASLCHNCGVNISEPLFTSSGSQDEPVCCPSCANAAVFCSPVCLNIAQTKYHNTTCGNELVDPLGRHENSTTPSEDLYFLLLARVFAMSHSKNKHPLELQETKYLWAMFAREFPSERKPPRTLPFTFQHNIILPFRLLSILSEEHPEMSPFSPQGLNWYDTWVVETLYAKFRGVASARQSTWDGKPEVAAVHPLWSLANHSCAPNVEWGWGSDRAFHVREQPVLWGDHLEEASRDAWKGIKAGEEILSHYCDVDLSVKDRREYMLGSLGGECLCERCKWEAAKGEQWIEVDNS